LKKIFFTLTIAIACCAAKAQNTPWSTSGSIGIGTNNPTTGLLVVQGIITSQTASTLTTGNNDAFNLYAGGGGYTDGARQSIFWSQSGTPLGRFGTEYNASRGQIDFIWRDQYNFGVSPTESMRLTGGGKLGIGTTNPTDALDVKGNPVFGLATERLSFASAGLAFNRQVATGAIYDNTRFAYQFTHTGGSTAASDYLALQVYNSTGAGISSDALVVNGYGNVLIGQVTQGNYGYKLDIAGNARANAINVNVTGADFVFEPSYKLYSLHELKYFIDKNHHLPEIPSAKEMQKDGLNVGENQVKLLQKVEELTLYLIDKDKQLNDEKDIIGKQQKEIDQLKEQMQQLITEVKKSKTNN